MRRPLSVLLLLDYLCFWRRNGLPAVQREFVLLRQDPIGCEVVHGLWQITAEAA